MFTMHTMFTLYATVHSASNENNVHNAGNVCTGGIVNNVCSVDGDGDMMVTMSEETMSVDDMSGAGVKRDSDGFIRTRDYDAGTKDYRGPFIPCATSNNPRPGQWDGRRMSRKMIADYKRFVVTDGYGIRNSLYVSGCAFACSGWKVNDKGEREWAGCFNKSIWNFNAGKPYTQELEDRIISDLSYRYVKGITLLGGEPFLNTPVLIPLCKRIREEYGDSKDIWSWSGYTWEELHRDGETPDKLELLSYVDVLVDGRYDCSMKDPLLQFRGSANQRIIDVKQSDAAGKVVIWGELTDGKHRVEEYGVDARAQHEGTES